ncbi:MAG: VOC family protein [Vicinamibacterales bacterium]
MTVEVNQHLFPVLRYPDARAALEWLVRCCRGEVRSEHAGPDGAIVHAEVAVGPSIVAVSETADARDDNPWSAVRSGMYVRVSDLTRHHDRATRAGVEIVSPLKDTPYGTREYTARDVGGHLWAFGTYDMGAVPAEGSPNLFVGLRYPDGRAAIRQLTEGFGFETTLEVPADAGGVAHAELTYGGGVVMLGDQPKADGPYAGLTYSLAVKIDYPDEDFARMRDAGADIVQEPKDTPYGARGFLVRDPGGFIWGFSTYRPNTVPGVG